MTTLQQLIDESHSQDKDKNDFTVKTASIVYNEEGLMTFPDQTSSFFGGNGITALPLNDHALWQVCTRLKTPPAPYMTYCRNNAPDLMSANLNRWQGKVKKEDWLIRSYKQEARAVLSSSYVPVDNTEILTTVDEILKMGRGGITPTLVRPYLHPNYLFLKLTVADIKGSNYAIGVQLKNGEIGNYSVEVSPFIQRHSCTNSIVMGDEGWSHRHIGVSRAGMFAFLKERIGNALQVSAQMIDAVVMAQAHFIPNIDEVIAQLAKKHHFTAETTSRIFTGTEGELNNLMGLVNGLSFAAHSTPQLKDAQRVELEELAGKFFSKVMVKSNIM